MFYAFYTFASLINFLTISINYVIKLNVFLLNIITSVKPYFSNSYDHILFVFRLVSLGIFILGWLFLANLHIFTWYDGNGYGHSQVLCQHLKQMSCLIYGPKSNQVYLLISSTDRTTLVLTVKVCLHSYFTYNFFKKLFGRRTWTANFRFLAPCR